MKDTKIYQEKLAEFAESDAAKKTVKELLTSTSNVALPHMVQAQAILQLGVWNDAREFCEVYPFPIGAGKTMDVQILQSPTYQKWNSSPAEGGAATPADPTVAKATITLAPYGQATLVSDLLANTSAIKFIEKIGELHGESVRKALYDVVVDELVADAGNSTNCASASLLTFAEVVAAIKLNNADGSQPDAITCAPEDMWNAFTTSYAVTQFTGALADLLAQGAKPNALGLEWRPDPYFTTATSGVVGVVFKKKESAVYAALQDEPVVEIYREPLKISNTVVTHMDFGAQSAIAGSICKILPAT